MAQRATITVNDRASTPLAHAFVPQGDSAEGVALFCETAGVKIGEKKLSISVRKSGTNYKVRLKLDAPVLVTEVVNGVSIPKVSRTAYGDVTFTFAEQSLLQERKDLVGMIANALASSQTVVDASVTGLEAVW